MAIQLSDTIMFKYTSSYVASCDLALLRTRSRGRRMIDESSRGYTGFTVFLSQFTYESKQRGKDREAELNLLWEVFNTPEDIRYRDLVVVSKHRTKCAGYLWRNILRDDER